MAADLIVLFVVVVGFWSASAQGSEVQYHVGDGVFWKGLGLGGRTFWMPGSWEISSATTSVKGDLNVYSFAIGPKYYYSFGPGSRWAFDGGMGIGGYKTNANLTISGVTISQSKTSFGYNMHLGLDYQVYKKFLLGLKGAFDYISNTGDKDDATVTSFGPTLGFVF